MHGDGEERRKGMLTVESSGRVVCSGWVSEEAGGGLDGGASKRGGLDGMRVTKIE